jgi:hypothetical protein
MQQYKATFNLASAAGQLITTIGTMNPARLYNGNPSAVAARRKLRCVTVTAASAITQTFNVGIRDVDGTNRIVSSYAVVAATDAYFEPEHDIWISGNENYQVDLTATAAPAVTGVLTVFTEES